jgi:hypothetical protein
LAYETGEPARKPLLAAIVRVIPGIPGAKVDDLLWLSSILES